MTAFASEFDQRAGTHPAKGRLTAGLGGLELFISLFRLTTSHAFRDTFHVRVVCVGHSEWTARRGVLCCVGLSLVEAVVDVGAGAQYFLE